MGKKMAGVICFGVPLASLLTLVTCDAGYDPSSNLYWTHVSRDMFTCSPRLKWMWLEVVCVHVHFLACSLVIVWDLFHVGQYIAKVTIKKRRGLSRMKTRYIMVDILGACPRVFLLFFFMLLLLGIHFVLMIVLVPRWEDFGTASEEWLTCKRLEDACLTIESSVGMVSECEGHRDCGVLRAQSDIPSVAIMELYNFTRAGLVLIVGVAFVFNRHNLTLAVRTLQQCKIDARLLLKNIRARKLFHPSQDEIVMLSNNSHKFSVEMVSSEGVGPWSSESSAGTPTMVNS